MRWVRTPWRSPAYTPAMPSIRARVVGGSLSLLLVTGLVAVPSAQAAQVEPAKPSPTVPAGGVGYTIVAPRNISPSGLVARVILPKGSACPDLVTETSAGGSVTTPMSNRPAPRNTRAAFTSAVVCQALVPTGATGKGAITVKGQSALSVPVIYPSQIDKVAIFGDSGCGNSGHQNCFDALTWPLSSFSSWAAEGQADVLLHVGDYIYLANGCPKDLQKNCKGAPPRAEGAPFDDSVGSWMFQFFSMAGPVFSQMPIVAARGNMELCNQAGNGYFWLLDPGMNSQNTCSPRGWGSSARTPVRVMDPYAVEFTLADGGALNVVVVDSSYVSLRAKTPMTLRYRQVFKQAAGLTKPGDVQNWMVTQQPIFAYEKPEVASKKDEADTNWVETFYQVASFGLLGKFDAILDGHIHTAQVVQIPGAPATLTVGSTGHTGSGSDWDAPKVGPLMEPGTNKPQFPLIGGYPKATFMWNDVVHAYAMADLQASGAWKVDFIRGNKETINNCTLTGSTVTCVKKSD